MSSSGDAEDATRASGGQELVRERARRAEDAVGTLHAVFDVDLGEGERGALDRFAAASKSRSTPTTRAPESVMVKKSSWPSQACAATVSAP
jgi:hypothetical protein